MNTGVWGGRAAYIVGGSSGIGLSTARLLAEAGASVVVFARSQETLDAALAQIESRRVSPDQRFAVRRLDVTDHAAVDVVMGEAVAALGVPDLLVNAAGRALPHCFEDVAYEQFDETMQTNLYGVWNAVSALAPHMKARGGAIVNVSSIAGFLGVFGLTDYCASKFAVVGLSEALRQELEPFGITVQVLCPPDTDTPGFAREPHEAGGDESCVRRRQAHDAGRGGARAARGHPPGHAADRPRGERQARALPEAARAGRRGVVRAAHDPQGPAWERRETRSVRELDGRAVIVAAAAPRKGAAFARVVPPGEA